MKRILITSLLILMMAVLAACGGDNGGEASDTDTTNDTPDTSSETTDAGFTATVSGNVETEITGPGYFLCDEVGFGELTIGATGSLSDNILLIVPIDATAGSSYDIVSERMGEEQAVGNYVGDDLQTAYYDDEASGTITLDAVASQAGERVAGNFEFSANNQGGDTVTVSGTFDFEAGPDAYVNCNGEGE
jgi:hypothetical protein